MPAPDPNEIFELVDETGRVIGTAPRGRCHGDPSLLHQSIHVFVFDRTGNLFLQKRAMTKDSQPGKWDSSVGGHMAPGETPEESARRETIEELGFAPIALTFAYHYIWRSSFESEYIRTFITNHDGPFKLDPVEICEGRFWSRDEITAQLAEYGKTESIFTPQFRQEYPRLLGWLRQNPA